MAGRPLICCHADVMSVCPFPSAARARRQIMRRHGNEIPAHLLPAPREPQDRPGVYVLSTRRPGAVSGPS